MNSRTSFGDGLPPRVHRIIIVGRGTGGGGGGSSEGSTAVLVVEIGGIA